MFGSIRDKSTIPEAEDALPGRSTPMAVAERHVVLGTPLLPPFPESIELAMFGLGCFWGAERIFWKTEGVYTSAVGYAAGSTPNPTYEEVCTGKTGHNEVVRVGYDVNKIHYRQLVELFFESHDPTQSMRQGNDVGTQYRSGIYVYDAMQRETAFSVQKGYEAALEKAGYGPIVTEILDAPSFYYAEDYHQQYLAKNPNGYCGLGGTGIDCPSS